jgi:hypothetical protein
LLKIISAAEVCYFRIVDIIYLQRKMSLIMAMWTVGIYATQWQTEPKKIEDKQEFRTSICDANFL